MLEKTLFASRDHPASVRPNSLLLILLVWMAGLAVSSLPPNWDLERQAGLQLLFSWRGPVPPPDNIAIVAINRASAARLGLPNRPDLWPRNLHAQLINSLNQLGVRSITFDVLFAPRIEREPERKTSPTSLLNARCNAEFGDQALASSIDLAGNVVLFMDLETDYRTQSKLTSQHLRLEKTHWPTSCIAETAAAVAPFVLPKIPSRVDQTWLFKPGAGGQASLPAMTLLIYTRAAWPEFCQQLRNASTSLGNKLPVPCPEATQSAEALSRAIIELRQFFEQTPELKDSLTTYFAQNHSPHAPELQALTRLFTAPEFPFVSYYGPAETIPTYNYTDLLHAATSSSPPDLRNVAVFVGLSELRSSQTDAFQTVFRDTAEGFDIAGVEIAATVFANLRDDKTVQPVSRPATMALLLLESALAVLLFQYISLRYVAFAAVALALLNAGIAYYLFTRHQLWIGFMVPILVQIPLALLLAMTWRFIKSRHEEIKVTAALRQLLPESVVQAIVKGKDLIVEGTTLEGVCLFSDGSQYTSLSETMEPENLRRFLNLYYPALFQPVEAHQGFVSDIVGDAMMAIWSDLQPSADSNYTMREHACLAALEIQDNVHRFNRAYPERQLPTRIGIHCGAISLGNVGARGHYEYRAVGDTVNVASRLEGLNKELGTTIIASAQTVEGLSRVLWRRMGSFTLRGKKSLLATCEIMANQENVTDRLLKLKADFETALTAFEEGDTQTAHQLFEQLTRDYPEDNSSRYYLKKCTENQ
ncbi:MAG: CHASE2 domain-containing protein [bacterium]